MIEGKQAAWVKLRPESVASSTEICGCSAYGSKRLNPGYPTGGDYAWSLVRLDDEAVEREAMRRAASIIGINLLDEEAWPDEAVVVLYHEQTVVEKGFAFLKDLLFPASSVFVKKPEHIMALAFIMVFCLLVYRLAEVRVRQHLAATGQTVPDQVNKPTAHRSVALALPVRFRASTCIIRCDPMARASPRSSG